MSCMTDTFKMLSDKLQSIGARLRNIKSRECSPMGHFFPTQRGNGFRLSVAGNEHSQQQAGKLPVDVVPRPQWSAGPRVPAHDMVEVDRLDRHIDRSRKESENCKNKTVT